MTEVSSSMVSINDRGALPANVSRPFCVPASVGVKVTLTVQLAPDARVAGGIGQVFV